MATPVVPLGKIEIAKRRGARIPLGWAVDAEGQPTDDPDRLLSGGSLLPLGSDREHGGHKGYCLGMMVDVLCAVLSGANWGGIPLVRAVAEDLRGIARRTGVPFD